MLWAGFDSSFVGLMSKIYVFGGLDGMNIIHSKNNEPSELLMIRRLSVLQPMGIKFCLPTWLQLKEESLDESSAGISFLSCWLFWCQLLC